MDENTAANEKEAEKGSVFSFSIDDIMGIVTKVLGVFKKLMAWLGILVLPEEGEYDYGNT